MDAGRKTEKGKTMPNRKLLLKVPEAAEMLSLSRSRLYELMAEGCERPIPVIRIGRSVRIPLADLERWVAEYAPLFQPGTVRTHCED